MFCVHKETLQVSKIKMATDKRARIYGKARHRQRDITDPFDNLSSNDPVRSPAIFLPTLVSIGHCLWYRFIILCLVHLAIQTRFSLVCRLFYIFFPARSMDNAPHSKN